MLRGILALGVAPVLFGLSGTVDGALVHNTFGLSSPDQTLTFDEVVLATDTSVTTQYSSFGVSFSSELFYDGFGGPIAGGVLPNLSGHYLSNFDGGDPPTVTPFLISFASMQSAAAFSMSTNSGTSTFTALLAGMSVESFNAATNSSNTNNYFGFSGISFDAIRVDPGGTGGAALIDNLQFVASEMSVVPESSSMALMGLSAFGMCVMRRRRKREQVDEP